MGLGELLNRIGIGKPKAATASELRQASMPPGITEDYRDSFIASCNSMVTQIREAREELISRSLRDTVEDLCQTVGRITARCESYPEGIFYARDVPPVLQLVPEMVREHARLHRADLTGQNPELIATAEHISDLATTVRQFEKDMSGGTIANLEAHNRTLASFIQRYGVRLPNLESLTEEDDHAGSGAN
ncbi:MAG: hypothetical protein K1X83_00215 [Oligoflexia bacterium]|nr:hypothetical protein [Oligoflexia bacterium]